MVGGDRIGDLLKQGRLAGFGRRYDQRALALANRTEHVEDSAAHLERRGLHFQPVIWVDWYELVKLLPAANGLRILAINGLDLEHAMILFVVFGLADLTGDQVPS